MMRQLRRDSGRALSTFDRTLDKSDRHALYRVTGSYDQWLLTSAEVCAEACEIVVRVENCVLSV